MFEFITNPEERGQVGIGTLIVFIAMVLVAAIAAGVLINTAGFLQTQAEATGEESTDLVSERIDVTSEVGIVGSEANGELSEIRLSVSGAPGADQIDLSETTIQAVGPGGQENLVFVSSTGSGNTQLSTSESIEDGITPSVTVDTVDETEIDDISSGDSATLRFETEGESAEVTDSVENLGGTVFGLDGTAGDATLQASNDQLTEGEEVTITLEDGSGNTLIQDTETVAASGSGSSFEIVNEVASIDGLSANEFAVGSDGSFESTPVLDEENDYTILINPDAGAFADTGPFGEGQSATLDIVSPAGATTSVELRAPDLFNKDGEAVRL
nr:archaellin/type IV pilin N-terminal domain-containing protein [Halorubrum sp. 2020YC2]